VLNNPIRYNDPTGHVCSDPDDPTPSCESGNPYPNNTNPLPSGPVNIPGGPLDPGLPQGGGSDDECNEGHCYETDNIVCPAEFNCTAEEMQEYATMFQYPGQLPWNPVQNNASSIVAPFNMYYLVVSIPSLGPLLSALNPVVRPLGAIHTTISEDGLTLTNVSEPTHIFHVGDVERSYYQDGDGAWHVRSVGTGTNDTPFFGALIDNFNDAVGPSAFNFTDNLMAAYISLDQ